MQTTSPETPKFSLDRRVNVSHIITTVGLLVGAVFYVSNQQNAMSNLHKEDTRINKRIDKLEDDTEESMREIKGYLQRIEEKIDRKKDK